MAYLYLIFRTCLRSALWLLFGALVYLWLFGEPDLSRVGTWGVMVFWPLVLLWYAAFWALLIAAVAGLSIYGYRKLA